MRHLLSNVSDVVFAIFGTWQGAELAVWKRTWLQNRPYVYVPDAPVGPHAAHFHPVHAPDSNGVTAVWHTRTDANMLWSTYEANRTYPSAKWVFVMDGDTFVLDQAIQDRIKDVDWHEPIVMGMPAMLGDGFAAFRPPLRHVRDDSLSCAAAPVCSATTAVHFQRSADCCACPTVAAAGEADALPGTAQKWHLARPTAGGKAVYRAFRGFMYGGTGVLLSRGLLDAIPAEAFAACAERLVCGSGDWRLHTCIANLARTVRFVDTSDESRRFLRAGDFAELVTSNIGLLGQNLLVKGHGGATRPVVDYLSRRDAVCPWHLHKAPLPCAELLFASGTRCAGEPRGVLPPPTPARLAQLLSRCLRVEREGRAQPRVKERRALLGASKQRGGNGGGGSSGGNGGGACCRWDAPSGVRQGPGCGAPNPPPLPGAWTAALPLGGARLPVRVLLITMNHGSAGFFAYVQFVINQLRYAEVYGLTPYVHFGRCTVNGEDHYASGGANLYFNASSGAPLNMWEQYFEPVSSYNYGDPVPEEPRGLPSRKQWRLHHTRNNSVYAYPYGMHKKVAKYPHRQRAAWYRQMRQRGRATARKYIRVKPHVRAQAEAVWRSVLAGGSAGAPVLGMHVRATDKRAEIGGGIVGSEAYFEHVDHCLAAFPATRLFLATDSPAVVKQMRARYGARLFAREIARSESNALFDTAARAATPGAQQGIDVLVDALLLARCDGLLKSASAVSEFATYLSDHLLDRTVDLQYGRARHALGAPCGRRPDGPAALAELPALPPRAPADGAPTPLQRQPSGGSASPAWQEEEGTLPPPTITSPEPPIAVPLRCLAPDWPAGRTRLLPTADELHGCTGRPARPRTSRLRRGSSQTMEDGRITQRAFSEQLTASVLRACGARPHYTVRLLPAGWFSTVNGAVKPLMHALAHGGALLPPTVHAFTDEARCARRDLTCFFQPPAPRCRTPAAAAALSIGAPLKRKEKQQLLKGMGTGGPPARDLSLLDEQSQRAWEAGEVGGGLLPPEWRRRGWFWWASQSLAHLMRPNRALARALARTRNVSGLATARARGERVVGLHVRHGDACLPEETARMARTCEPLAAYLPIVGELARAIGTDVVLLVTDSPAVLDDARRHTGGLRFLFTGAQPAPPTASGGGGRAAPPELWDRVVKARLREGTTARTFDEAWAATLDVLLLAETDALVGKFTSNVFRNAYSLRAASCDCAVPFASLDAPWCFDYGKLAGSNPRRRDAPNGGRFWC